MLNTLYLDTISAMPHLVGCFTADKPMLVTMTLSHSFWPHMSSSMPSCRFCSTTMASSYFRVSSGHWSGAGL